MIQIDVATIGERLGEEIAVSPWLDITQERINRFAEATDDRQWIHVDAAKAAAESPFRSTIAHGFLTLSLVSVLLRTSMAFSPTKMVINYGVNRVRFVSAVPSGSRIRGHFTPALVEEVPGGVQVTWNITIEREGHEKPACIVEWIVRYYI
jgi:acyl dehydratase